MHVCRKCGKRFSGPERFCSRDGAPLVEEREAPGDPLIGCLLGGRYRIESRLGEGGMGAVYVARQETIGREVAVKVLRGELSVKVGTVRRFLREALACSKLDHPNIVRVFDFGRDDQGRYYIVMELVEGTALVDLIGRLGPIPQTRAIPIVEQLLAAAEAAHAAGVVHRDLKPENVLCFASRDGADQVKVLDFGLAKIVGEDDKSGRLTRDGFVVGTPEFMAPEQAWGRGVDHRSDLYSIGVIAYEMLTGVLPFQGPAADVARLHISEPPWPPADRCPEAGIHPDLEAVVLTLLAKKPEERFQTARAARNAFRTVARWLAAEAEQEENLLRRTRAAVRPQPKTAAPGPSSAEPLTPIPVSGLVSPTLYVATGVASARDDSELMEEMSRLARLWSRRVVEAADLLWGAGERPIEMERLLEAASSGEERLIELETEVALERDHVRALESDARLLDAEYRFRRLDLVAQLGALEAGDELGPIGAGTAEGDGPAPSAETGPIGLPEVDGAVAARDIRTQIDGVDQLSASSSARFADEIGRHEERITGRLEKAGRLRRQLVPVYTELAEMVKRQASGRPELAEHVKALAEVVGAIQVYQGMIEPPR